MMSTEIVKKEQHQPERVSQRRAVQPRVDLYENDQELLMLADLPGVDKDLLSIEVHEGTLSVEGRRSRSDASGRLAAGEVEPADFARRFALPDGIDVDNIVAEVNEGVLRLRLPKAKAFKPRQIPISTG